MALGGTVSDETLTLGLTLNKWGNILVDEKYQTSDTKIFAGGDLAGNKRYGSLGSKIWKKSSKKYKKILDF